MEEVEKVLNDLDEYVVLYYTIQNGIALYYMFPNGGGALVSKGDFKDGVEIDIYDNNISMDINFKYKTMKSCSEILYRLYNDGYNSSKKKKDAFIDTLIYEVSKNNNKLRDNWKHKKHWHMIFR